MTTSSGLDDPLLQFLYRAPIGLAQTTLDGTIEMINPMSAQLLMPITPTGDLDNLFDVLQPVAPQLRSLVAAFDQPMGVVCEALRFAVDGFHRGAARTYAISLMKVDASRLMVVLVDDTGEVRREAAEVAERLHRAARIDTLTRMPNRVAITEAMRIALAGSTSPPCGHVAILMIGCERLQDLGESFGNDLKNQVLELMARRLSSVLRPGDGMGCAGDIGRTAARISGDEFVVLLEQLSHPGDASLVAQRILDALAKPYAVGKQQLHCAVSVGVLHCEADGSNPDDALRDAGLAMREAKRVGGSRWMEFETSMRERAVRRGSIEMDLRRALVEDQLFVVYQPIVSLQDGATPSRSAGVEALVRWRHPDRGIVPPIDFIGIAEELGLIVPLGRFVLETACRQFAAWSDALGERAPWLLAVNLSRAQLADATLVDAVRHALEASGLPPERLQLEVTESLAAQDDSAQARLHDLKSLGLKLALDDFGTGYSSLSSLHLLPVDTVKIDRSFVMLAESSPHHRVLIEATIRVAKSLGMTTVAEGIETAGQAAIVRDLGCDKGQGYRYSRPLMADDLRAWVEAN
jgi:diguanylate cyclase (GGDEF)-like protein